MASVTPRREYTPTTSDVRAWVFAQTNDDSAFLRWLDAVRTNAKADAWDEGFDAWWVRDEPRGEIVNPYRAEGI